MNVRKQRASKIILRPNLTIGAISAEEDKYYLEECFVVTENYECIADMDSAKCIVLGRTGSGKSAIIDRLKRTQDNVISIDPQSLSLNYISNSDILRFFERIGVDLNIFYQLLWRHVLAIELIRYKYHLDTETKTKRVIAQIYSMLGGNKKKEKAFDYLLRYGNKFWLDTEERVKEVTDNLQASLSAIVEFEKFGIKAKLGGEGSLSKKQVKEVKHLAQKVVNNVQMQELNDVISILAEDLFVDKKNKFFITIDELDESWVVDDLRYKLIRSLIETIKKFRKINTVKIVVALRADLLESVLEKTRVLGFQEEKFEDLFQKIRWNKDQLRELVDSRVRFLFKHKYSGKRVEFDDVFFSKVGESEPFEYLLERTLLRPRDIISFVNICLENAQGNTGITAKNIRDAEGSYSAKRLANLTHEWGLLHPLLERYCKPLSSQAATFRLNDIPDSDFEDLILELTESENRSKDVLAKLAVEALSGKGFRLEKLRNKWARALYKIGIIGIKPEAAAPVMWASTHEPVLKESEIRTSTAVFVHPMMWRALGVHADIKKIRKA